MGEDYHGLLVNLYAEYDTSGLLRFLQSSNNYPLESALEVCLQRNLIHEAVFLLGRMGNLKQALQMITRDLEDIDKAIQFCMEHDDKDLWDDLIDYSVDKPAFIKVLLENIGTHVDPIILIQRIPDGMVIPDLQVALVKILQDYNLQVNIFPIIISGAFSLSLQINKN